MSSKDIPNFMFLYSKNGEDLDRKLRIITDEYNKRDYNISLQEFLNNYPLEKYKQL